LIGLVVALAVTILSPLASSHPDGLERVAEDQGFIGRALDPFYEIIPDYLLPGISNEAISTILAGMIGVLLVAGVVYLLARLTHARPAA